MTATDAKFSFILDSKKYKNTDISFNLKVIIFKVFKVLVSLRLLKGLKGLKGLKLLKLLKVLKGMEHSGMSVSR